jgi:hypothetical protein
MTRSPEEDARISALASQIVEVKPKRCDICFRPWKMSLYLAAEVDKGTIDVGGARQQLIDNLGKNCLDGFRVFESVEAGDAGVCGFVPVVNMSVEQPAQVDAD